MRKNIGPVIIYNKGWEEQTIPDGWIWQDIGNYYGAGAGLFNWRENQFDVFLKSGSRIGAAVDVVGTKPPLYAYKLRSAAASAAKGSGDNAYIYLPVNGQTAVVRGTIPVNEPKFTISGALPQPEVQFVESLRNLLHDIMSETGAGPLWIPGKPVAQSVVYAVSSPPLDSIIYWFNKKSVNLYGEALIKTIAFEKTGVGAAEKGIKFLQDFWNGKGIPETELNMVDGSGLSPLNRVTARAQVGVLQFAQQQDWFGGFYNSLTEYNGMRMKSGTIRNVKGFTGYHTSAKGERFVFSFLVNNYHGSAAALVPKMYAVLNVLK